jgi:hypothetical protein
LVLAFVLALRYLSYRETLALAEKGLVRPGRLANGNGKAALIWGVLLTAIGVALCVGLWPLGLSSLGYGRYPLGFGPWMLLGLLPTFFGLGLILVYVLTREGKKPAAEENPAEGDPKLEA